MSDGDLYKTSCQSNRGVRRIRLVNTRKLGSGAQNSNGKEQKVAETQKGTNLLKTMQSELLLTSKAKDEAYDSL